MLLYFVKKIEFFSLSLSHYLVFANFSLRARRMKKNIRFGKITPFLHQNTKISDRLSVDSLVTYRLRET